MDASSASISSAPLKEPESMTATETKDYILVGFGERCQDREEGMHPEAAVAGDQLDGGGGVAIQRRRLAMFVDRHIQQGLSRSANPCGPWCNAP